MDENVKSQIKIFGFMLLLGIAVITLLSWLNNSEQNTIYVDTSTSGVSIIRQADMSRNQLTWDDIKLRDDTIYNLNGSCQASHNGMGVYFPECNIRTATGEGLEQKWIFNTNVTSTYLFVYEGQLQSGRMYWLHNMSYQESYLNAREQYINNFLVTDVFNYTDLGTPSNQCEIGTKNNTFMYQVIKTNGTIQTYCFSSRTIINATAFRISGNATIISLDQRTAYKIDYDDVTNLVTDVTDQVPSQMRKNFSFYKVDEINAGTYEGKWLFTPKNKARSGKFHVLIYPSSKTIVDAYNSGDYAYNDPTWSPADCYATGGNITINGDYCVHTFLANGTLNVTDKVITNVTILVVAGGGGGSGTRGGGGGAGGVNYSINRTLTQLTNYSVTIGAGGSGSVTSSQAGFNGDNSSFSTLVLAVGGGAGGIGGASNSKSGGSGGGGGTGKGVAYLGGIQGRDGGLEAGSPSYGAGGGGGAGQNGSNGATNRGGNGGNGTQYNITGTSTYYAGGGGGSTFSSSPAEGGDGGLGGGGKAGMAGSYICINGTNGLGGGGGGDTGATACRGGSGIVIVTYKIQSTSYTITNSMNAPIDAYTSNNTFVTFNFTFYPDNATLNNWTLSVWYSNSTLNHIHQLTGLSETSNVTYTHNDTLFPQNSYIWGLNYCGTLGNTSTYCANSVNRTFTIHTDIPYFVLVNMTNISTLTFPANITFNITTTDPSLSVCQYWTSDNATKQTYTCNTTQTAMFQTGGWKNITVWANDTFGNVNYTNYSVAIHGFNVTQYENADPIAEGSTSIIYLNINSTNFPIGDANAIITWNGSAKSPTAKTSVSADTIRLEYSFSVIAGLGNSTGKLYSYNWTYNATQLSTRTTPTTNQTIISFGIDDCSVYNIKIANFSIKDEELNSYFANTTGTKLEVEALVTSLNDTSVTWTYSQTFINKSSVKLCVPNNVLNSSNFTIDMTVGVEADAHVREFWYLDNGTLANNYCYFNSYTPCDVNLMDLLTTDSTTFLFAFTDENDLEVDNAIVHVFRKYIGEGVFREVERSRQDNNGQTHVHLVEEDVIYYFMITQEGRIIYTSNTYNAKCLSTPCEISLSASPSDVNWSIIDNKGGRYSVTTNKATRMVTTTFNLQESAVVNATIYQEIGGVYSIINSSTLTSSAGSITLHVPLSYGNSTFFIAIYKNNQFVKSQWISLVENAEDYFGTFGAILGGIVVLAMMLMAITEGAGFIVFTILALIIIGVMQLVDLGWMAIISIVCAGGIIVWKLINRRQTKQ